MDTGFFSSKAFIVSAVVAALLLGAGAAAYAVSGGPGAPLSQFTACRAPSLAGSAVTPVATSNTELDGRRRVETYTFDAASHAGGQIELCDAVGEIAVGPATGSQVQLTFTIVGATTAAVEQTDVEAAFTAEGNRLHVAGWEARAGRGRGMFGEHESDVRIELRLPTTTAWRVRAHTDVGDVDVRDLRLDELALSTDVGHVVAGGIDLQGAANVHSDVGDVTLRLASVQSGAIEVHSDVGDVAVELPTRADVGYDAYGASDVGNVDVRIGPTEAYDSEGDGAGEVESARSVGYADKPTKVTVRGTADVGDVRIAVMEAQ